MCCILSHLYLMKHFTNIDKPLRVNNNNLAVIVSHVPPVGRQQDKCFVALFH